MKIQIDITTDVEKIIYMCELHIWEDWQITSRAVWGTLRRIILEV